MVSICGWGQDEPIDELLASAAGQPWDLAVTGRQRAGPTLAENVNLTGFLDDAAYGQLLASADLVVVLTNRDETLLSGAWEALALGRPLIVSATPALIATFGEDIACVRNDARSIALAIQSAVADLSGAERSKRAASEFRRANDAALDLLRVRLAPQP